MKKFDKRFSSYGNTALMEFENTYQDAPSVKGIKNAAQVDASEISIVTTQPTFQPLSSTGKNEVIKLKVKQANVDVKLIHGEDDRKPVLRTEYPYNTICFLSIDAPFQNTPLLGTGFFISKRCVLTAGHCVFSNSQWMSSITVIPGVLGTVEPFGSQLSRQFRSVSGWIKDKNSNFDYGAIILDSDKLYAKVNATLGFSPSSNETEAEITGYPLDKSRMPFTATGIINSRSKFRLFYDIDTLEGNSGSPIFTKTANDVTVVGIHTDGDNPNNAGVRFRQELIDRLNEWILL